MGRRVRKQRSVYNGSTWSVNLDQKYVYDGWNVVLVLVYDSQTEQDVVTRKYTWGLDLSGTLQGAGGVGGLLAAVETQGTHQGSYWYLYDGNGNVGQLLDATTPASPALEGFYEYDPYGNAVGYAPGGYAAVNPLRFSTKWLDKELASSGQIGAVGETGLYYYGYRYHSPRLGRFLNRDPLNEPGALLLRPAAASATVSSHPLENEASLYRYVMNSPMSVLDPLGLADTSTSQPTTTQAACHYCGPDMTAWFSQELNIHAKFWRSVRGNIGPLLRPLYFAKYASTIPYKWTKFETAHCPSGPLCKDTVMLCETCIHKSELGNIMYGAIAKLWLRGEQLIVGAAVGKAGTGSLEDIAGVVGGLSLGDLAAAGDISQNKLCELLQSNQSAYIGRIRALFDPTSPADVLLGKLGGNNLSDMGKPFTSCQKCPDSPPSIPHSSFTWIKTTKDIASGNWRQTYPQWPIDWPK